MPTAQALRIVVALAAAVALAAFLALLLLHPLGLQAILAGGLRDVEVSPSSLTLYASNRSLFCYEGVLEVRNLGGAGLAYELSPSLEGSAAYLSLSAGGEQVLVRSPGSSLARRLRIEAGSALRLTVCLMAPAERLNLVFFDERFREATEASVEIRVVETDWWSNRFPRRLSISPAVSRGGLALFEVLGSGEVYVNGRYAGRVHALSGVDASSLAVVLVRGGASYLLPFQVEAWDLRGDGVAEPRGLRSGLLQPYDRLVFAAYVESGARVDVYLGGALGERFEAAGSVEGGVVEVGGLRVELDEYGFSAPGLYVNLSGRIAFPYVARLEHYSDWGRWRVAAAGPVRVVAAFRTIELSGYAVEAFLMVWGLNLNVTQLEVWPRTIRRGIVLDWAAPLINAAGVEVELVCGTACAALPLRLEPWGVKLCEDYWQPGDHTFGYFTLLFKWSELGSVASVRGRLESFPGG